MNLLKEQKRFTFTYGDTPFEELNHQTSQTETDNTLTTVYTFEDGFQITNIAIKRGEGYEWVNWLENTSDTPTRIISNLWDAYITLPLPHEEKLKWTAFQPEFDEVTTVYAPAGSTWSFNTDPLDYWLKNDPEDRVGISEIKHINGLYRLWDHLLERFPHLLIDNCASGGRRIDIETLRRSIPLWRSDFQCTANYLLKGAQCHNLAFNQWMPYSGTGSGRSYDTYRMRSAYSPALMSAHTFSDGESFGTDPEKISWLKNILDEYLKVHPMMGEDFYPLTEISDRNDVWSACQFDRPSESDGFLQIFRREKSPYESASLQLYAIDMNCDYCFTDADDNSQFTISGADISRYGLHITIPQKRTAKIYFYRKVR